MELPIINDASPAYRKLLQVDHLWHECADFLSLAGAPWSDAADYADSEVKLNHHQNGESKNV